MHFGTKNILKSNCNHTPNMKKSEKITFYEKIKS
jgi:hypothetical protein